MGTSWQSWLWCLQCLNCRPCVKAWHVSTQVAAEPQVQVRLPHTGKCTCRQAPPDWSSMVAFEATSAVSARNSAGA